MELSKLNYSFFVLISIVLLIVFLKKTITRANKPVSKKIYIVLLSTAILYMITEIIWNLYVEEIVVYSIIVCYAVNEMYFIVSAFLTMLFMWYVEANIDESCVKKRWNGVISTIPAIVTMLLTLSTYWTKAVFWIDEAGVYHRSSLANIHLFVCCLYGGMSFLHLAALAFRKENYAYRKKMTAAMTFAGTIIVFCVLQQFIPQLPLNVAGILIGVVMEYTNVSESLISLDPLTKINNKNQLFTYVHSKMKNISGNTIFYLFIMDMDNFKKINDEFGHIEGDEAIIRVAEALKLTFSEKNAIICRYGGDEFIAAGECRNMEDIELLKENFEVTLQGLNRHAGNKYELNASIGTAIWNPAIKTIPDFIKIADQDLYRMKKMKKEKAR